MATTKEYKDFVLDNLSLLNNITFRPMMGEYLLYYNGILFGFEKTGERHMTFSCF